MTRDRVIKGCDVLTAVYIFDILWRRLCFCIVSNNILLCCKSKFTHTIKNVGVKAFVNSLSERLTAPSLFSGQPLMPLLLCCVRVSCHDFHDLPADGSHHICCTSPSLSSLHNTTRTLSQVRSVFLGGLCCLIIYVSCSIYCIAVHALIA